MTNTRSRRLLSIVVGVLILSVPASAASAWWGTQTSYYNDLSRSESKGNSYTLDGGTNRHAVLQRDTRTDGNAAYTKGSSFRPNTTTAHHNWSTSTSGSSTWTPKLAQTGVVGAERVKGRACVDLGFPVSDRCSGYSGFDSIESRDTAYPH